MILLGNFDLEELAEVLNNILNIFFGKLSRKHPQLCSKHVADYSF